MARASSARRCAHRRARRGGTSSICAASSPRERALTWRCRAVLGDAEYGFFDRFPRAGCVSPWLCSAPPLYPPRLPEAASAEREPTLPIGERQQLLYPCVRLPRDLLHIHNSRRAERAERERGIDDDPRLHLCAVIDMIGRECGVHADCGRLGNRQPLCSSRGAAAQELHRCAHRRQRLPDGYACKSVVSGTTIYGNACIPR